MSEDPEDMGKETDRRVNPYRLTDAERRALCERFARSSTRRERDRLADDLGISPGQLWNLWSRWQAEGDDGRYGGEGGGNGFPT